ncbi:hypothetical protein RI129_003409 [Pyrocoelia pectoralis]|uniref:Uncharacterized protein n=1 Tax=Pyrocoelia pectoralis TaxID=417401 RepID=A0AAN7ZMZ8_9COLE
MHYIKNQRKLLLGAPGVLGWRGTIVQVVFQDTGNLQVQRREIRERRKREIISNFDIPNPVYISSLDEDNLYFGYSISSGRFARKYRDLWYIAGSPRAADLHGMVLLFEFPLYDDSDLIVHRKLIGDQFGSYFGGSVLGVDTSDSGVVDLLVGAPTYVIDTWDEGCVIFYKNSGDGNFDKPLKVFGSKKTGARFGTAISAIGDINKDHFEDVAISAPYEEESGAVYIYLGGKNGLSKEYSQRILGKSIKPSVRGFGFSISKGIDTDRNFHNDIAIGAYKSGDVAVIKSRPVIKFSPYLSSEVEELLVNTSTIVVRYCMSYTSSSENVKQVEANVTILKDTRAKNNDDTVNTITLNANETFCRELDILMQEGNFDYTKPFTVEMSYALIDPPLSKFCPDCPVTDPSDSSSITLNIPFANGCGSDNICQPNLRLNVTTQTNLSSLIIGQLSTIKLHAQISNDGEPAYISQLFLSFPEDVDILLISSKCELNDDRVYECLVSNVLQPNAVSDLVFEFDIKKLNPKTQNLTFNFTVQSRGEEVNAENNNVSINIPLRIQNGVEISGISFPDSIIFVNENNEIVDEIVEFTQEYYLKNIGPSPMSGINATFFFPVEIENESYIYEVVFDVYEPDVMINNQAVTCHTNYHLGFYSDEVTGGESSELDEDSSREENRYRRSISDEEMNSPDVFDLPANRTVFVNCKSNNVTCMKVVCSSSEILSKNQLMLAKFKFRAHINILTKLTKQKDIVLLISTAESTHETKTVTYHVPTLLIGSAKKSDMSYWFYVGGVFVAFVILCIIVLILYRLNFFNRPVRERLQNEADEETECKELEIENNIDEVEEEASNK